MISSVGVDPVSLILAVGAAAGPKDTASGAATDSYESVKALITRWAESGRDGTLVLAWFEEDPQARERCPVAELTAAGAGKDAGLVAVAQALMRLADEAGYWAGKHEVASRGSRGVQVGDHDTRHSVFSYRSAAGDADGVDR